MVLATASLFPCAFHAFQTGTPDPILFPFGCMAGMILTPDLDINHPMIAESNIRRMTGGAGTFLAGFWYVYWFPYSRLIGHRSWVSHFPIVSTFIRLFYLLLLPGIVLYLLTGNVEPIARGVYSPDFWWFVGGLGLSDTVHFLMDITVTAIKRMW
jgi:uncharacterized metal-binding protein